MLFEHDILIETTHLVTNKKKTTIKLTHGVIHRLSIYFPPGCRHYVRCTVNRGLHQIYPTNPDGYIKGNALEVTGDVFHTMFIDPYQVEVYGWNAEATYDHTITVRFWVKKLWQLMPYSDQMYALALREEKGML